MLNPEHLLVPYECASLPPAPWLVFAPHADDETFGMGGSLLKARDAGLQTHVIVLTDGALGGQSEDLISARLQEVRTATDMLGVRSLQCWSEPDRGLVVSDDLVEKLSTEITRLKPASVFFPAVLELHPDHRATALLVWRSLQRLLALSTQSAESTFLPQAYGYEISVQSPVNRLIDITAQREEKANVMAVYVSQNGQTAYPELVNALDRARTFTLPAKVSHAEAFYSYTRADLERQLYDIAVENIGMYR